MDLSKLSFKELTELEQEIKRQKELRSDLKVYEVRFCIGVLAKRAEGDWKLESIEGLGDYFVNTPMRLMEKELGILEKVEGFTGCYVRELQPEEYPERFSFK
jgi:hypothetical protein